MSQEIEAKFALSHLGDFRQHLLNSGARLLRDRILERNWRFDKPDGSLTAAGKVLRLRRDIAATLTYKQAGAEPHVRTEIEFEVGDHQAAKNLIKALGYQVSLIYEKYRETFEYQQAQLDLDQLPFGSFVEIEAEDPANLRQIAEELGLAWDQRASMSYAEIFDHWKARWLVGEEILLGHQRFQLIEPAAEELQRLRHRLRRGHVDAGIAEQVQRVL